MCVAETASARASREPDVESPGMAMRTRAGNSVRQQRNARLRAAQQPAKLPPGGRYLDPEAAATAAEAVKNQGR